MNDLHTNNNDSPRCIRQHFRKRLKLGLVTCAIVLAIFIAQPEAKAGSCSTTTGDCTASIGLYIA